MKEDELHRPVLLSEVLGVLQPQRGESYLDLTAGYAGHASRILDVTQNYNASVLVDRDEFAVNYLQEKFGQGARVLSADDLQASGGKNESEPRGLTIIHDDFCSSTLRLFECGKTFDLILADFGVSSPQLDIASRGFSFSKPAPLDMRMDQSQTLTAEKIVNHWRERELQEIFERYGEEKPGLAQKHARVVAGGRPWRTTTELADAIAAGGRRKLPDGTYAEPTRKMRERMSHIRRHPATQVFQALRIVVNDELSLIERTLPILPKLLNPGGRVAIISFHSLEDRLVKQYFREASTLGVESELEVLTKSPIMAGNVELGINPRARSAKLRAAKRA